MFIHLIHEVGNLHVSVNILKNRIGIEQAQNLVAILQEHTALKSLCGNQGDETELNLRGKMSGAADAIMLAPEIVSNRAMTSLNISANNLTQGKDKGKLHKGLGKNPERGEQRKFGGACNWCWRIGHKESQC